MARSLTQIMAELDPYYTGSKTAYQTEIDALPGQESAAIAGADAKLAQANEGILSQARGRGLGFSGIPVAEQAKYAATEYAPAVANLKSNFLNKRTSLIDALNSRNRDQMTQAQSIFDADNQRDLAWAQLNEQKRQYDLTLAAQREAEARSRASGGGGSYSFGGASLGGGGGAAGAARAAGALAAFEPNKGYSFTNNGKGISAYAFSAQKGIPFRSLLQQMSPNDGAAKLALQLVGDDGYADPSKISKLNGAQRSALRALGVRNA